MFDDPNIRVLYNTVLLSKIAYDSAYSLLIDSEGNLRLWAPIKSQAEIELAWAQHAMEGVRIVEILMRPEDFYAYVDSAEYKERIDSRRIST